MKHLSELKKKIVRLLENNSFKTLIELLVLIAAVVGIWLSILSANAARNANVISAASLNEMQIQRNIAYMPELVVETSHATIRWMLDEQGDIHLTEPLTSELERLDEFRMYGGICASIVNIGQGTAKDVSVTYRIEPLNEEEIKSMEMLLDSYMMNEHVAENIRNNIYNGWEWHYKKPFILGGVQESWQISTHASYIHWIDYLVKSFIHIPPPFIHPSAPIDIGVLYAKLEISFYDIQGIPITEYRELQIKSNGGWATDNKQEGELKIVIQMIYPRNE